MEKQYQSLCESWRVELAEKQRSFEAAKAQILGPRCVLVAMPAAAGANHLPGPMPSLPWVSPRQALQQTPYGNNSSSCSSSSLCAGL